MVAPNCIDPSTHDRSWLTPVAQFCCALHNVKLRAKRNGDNYEIEWKHPIPQIPSPKKKYGKISLPPQHLQLDSVLFLFSLIFHLFDSSTLSFCFLLHD
jgi:hypothetical protein